METNEAAGAVAQENVEVREAAEAAIEETAKAVTSAVETADENKQAVEEAAAAVEESAKANAGATEVAAENKSSLTKKPVIKEGAGESMADYMDEISKKRPIKDDTKQIAWDHLKEAMKEKRVVETQITEVVKAGVLCHPEGLRAFIPASKLSLSFVEEKDLPSFVGKTVKARVITCDDQENKLVLSVRDVLREEQNKAKAGRIAAVKVGSIVEGKVESLTDFGAFVAIGDGVTGLVHVSRISHNHVKHPKDVLKEGETVRVKVVAVKDGKISLSIKDLEENAQAPEPEEKFEYKSEGEATTSLADLIKKAGF